MKNIPLYSIRRISTLKEMIETSTSLYGTKTAFLVKQKGDDSYKPVTYGQFKSDVDSLGTALMNLNLKGKRIAIISESRYEWAAAYLAVVNGAGIVVPLDKELPENEIESLLVRSKADAVFFSANTGEHVRNIAERCGFIHQFIDFDQSGDEGRFLSFEELLASGKKAVERGDDSFTSAVINPEVMSILLFTSATTDKSKAVMLSQRNICENLMAMCTMVDIKPTDIFLSILPLHHTYENTCGFLCPLYRGASIAHCEGLRHIQKNLLEAKATVMLGVPLIFEAMYKRIWDQAAKSPDLLKKLKFGIRLSSFLLKAGIDVRKRLFSAIHKNFGGNLRLLISGAAGIDPEVARGFRELGLDFLQGYGLTECSPIVALNRDVDYKDSAAGLPLPGLEIRIEDPGADDVGEIVVKGPSVMLGYYENQLATEKVLKDGWFYTGDLGYMDSESFVYITGRKKNVIVTKNGKNIYPEEIETLLNKSPYIRESMVYGKDDQVYGDVVVSAAIVPDMDKIKEDFGDRQFSGDEVYELVHKEVKTVNKSLVTYKYIKDFYLRDEEFAKTTTKKIKRYAVK